MDRVIAGVAVMDLAVDRDRTIGGHRAVVEELFEVGAVVFVVAPADACGAVRLFGGGLVVILPGESHGGGVLVQLAQGEPKTANGAEDEGGEQTGPISTLEVIESTPATVVVEQGSLSRQQAKILRDERCRPSGDGIEGLP